MRLCTHLVFWTKVLSFATKYMVAFCVRQKGTVMNKNTDLLERIADALEKIADLIEAEKDYLFDLQRMK